MLVLYYLISKEFTMKKLLLTALFTIFMLNIAPSQAKNIESKNNSITIAGGTAFGLRFGLAGGLCSILTVKECMVKPTVNSADAIGQVKSGAVELALVQSDWFKHAQDGTSRFSKSGANENLINIWSIGGEEAVLVVSKDHDINNIKDLKNKRVDMGLEYTYRRAITRSFLNAEGIGNNIKEKKLSQENSMNALCTNQIEGAVFLLEHPNTVLDNMIAQCNVKIISINDKQANYALNEFKGFIPSSIPADTYWGQSEKIKTIGLKNILVGNKDISPTLLKQIKRDLNKKDTQLRAMHPTLSLGE